MALFWIPEATLLTGSNYALDAEQTTHLIKSLRLRLGTTVEVTNGDGQMGEAVFHAQEKQQAQLQITQITDVNRPQPVLHVALSPLKNPDRFEWAVEKMTELGVASITPVLFERTEKPFVKVDRLARIAQSALRQSGGAWLTKINSPQSAKVWIDSLPVNCRKLLPYAIDRQELSAIPPLDATKEIALAIGPEGDFTVAELDFFQKAGFSLCSLGHLRLRSETAAIAAAAKIMLP